MHAYIHRTHTQATYHAQDYVKLTD